MAQSSQHKLSVSVIIIALCCATVSVEGRNVTVQCVNDKVCSIRDGNVNGVKGNDITLKYVIKTSTFISFKLKYNTTPIIEIAGSPKTFYPKDPHPDFLKLTNTLSPAPGEYSFTFEVVKLNATMQGKFIYDLSFGATDETGEIFFKVISGAGASRFNWYISIITLLVCSLYS